MGMDNVVLEDLLYKVRSPKPEGRGSVTRAPECSGGKWQTRPNGSHALRGASEEPLAGLRLESRDAHEPTAAGARAGRLVRVIGLG